ncbi:MAG: hypothetical protein ACYDEU_10580 [Vulcanimicrobiaceae bacterium]
MTAKHTRALALAAAVALSCLPAVSLAQASATAGMQTTNYRAEFTRLWGPSAPYVGRLNLRIANDGIINGFYRWEGSGNVLSVTGGLNGKHIWLDIGDQGRIQVVGLFENGSIVGMASNVSIGQPMRLDRGPMAAHDPFETPTQYHFRATKESAAGSTVW